MTGKAMTRPLTDAERALVERYHNLIYRVMHDLHLGTEADTDLYGEAALGLILAAQRYLCLLYTSLSQTASKAARSASQAHSPASRMPFRILPVYPVT